MLNGLLRKRPSEKRYATVKEAEKELGFPLILPSNIPEQFKQEKEVMVLNQTELGKIFVYVMFESDTDELHSFFKIDIIKEECAEGTSIAIKNNKFDKTYITPNNIEYEITKEKEEVTKTVSLEAKSYVGQYEYGIFTNGVEETAFYSMIDSVDLSSYKFMED